MSFSFEFNARSRKHALELLAGQTNVPDTVRAFVKTAIENIQPPAAGYLRLVLVKAHGHLCEGGTWSPHSSASITVQPVDIEN
jgi:hypothetical protein